MCYVRGGGKLVVIVGKNVWSKFETKRKKSIEFRKLAAEIFNDIKKKKKIER